MITLGRAVWIEKQVQLLLLLALPVPLFLVLVVAVQSGAPFVQDDREAPSAIRVLDALERDVPVEVVR